MSLRRGLRYGLPILSLLLTAAQTEAYEVILHAPSVGAQESRFTDHAMPESRFAPRPQDSKASSTSNGSSFGLKKMDAATRTKTEATLTRLGARREGNQIIVALSADVLFDFDKSDIRADARAVLAELGEALNAMQDSTAVAIVGHTDAKGSEDYNQALSERRAQSVRDWLEDHEVNADFTTSGQGESQPVAPNENANGSDNPDGRQKNRRVVFIIAAE